MPKTIHNLPKETGLFVDRIESVDRLVRLLLRDERAWLIAIQGQGGVGKSSLALRVAWKIANLDIFDYIVWANAKDYALPLSSSFFEDVSENVQDILKFVSGRKVDLIVNLNDLIKRFATLTGVKFGKTSDYEKEQVLREHLKLKKILLIIDNLETLSENAAIEMLRFVKNVLPFPDGKTIITSRLMRSGQGETSIIVSPLAKSDALLLLEQEGKRLRQISKFKNDDDISAILEFVGGNPLSIKWLVAQSKRNKKSARQVIDDIKTSGSAPLEYCFRASYLEIKKDLVSTRIITGLALMDTPSSYSEISTFSGVSIDDVDKALNYLEYFSFIEKVDNEDLVTIHPLTRTFLLEQPETQREFPEKWAEIQN